MGRRSERSLCPLLVSRLGREPLAWAPRADVYRIARGWLVKLELAGVRPEQIEVRACGRTLTISGMRQDVRYEESIRSYSLEISYNRFERAVELPCDLEPMDTSAEYRDGMLILRVTQRGDEHD